MDLNTLYKMLDSNQYWLKKLSLFHPSFYWDSTSRSFRIQRRKMRHLYLGLLMDFILVFGIYVMSCLVVFWDAVHHPANYELLECFFVFGEFMVLLAEICAAITLATNCSDLCNSGNEVFASYNARFSNTNKIQQIRTNPKDITMWILLHAGKKLVLFTFSLPIFATAIVYFFEVDVVYLVLTNVLLVPKFYVLQSRFCIIFRVAIIFIIMNSIASKAAWLLQYCIFYTTFLLRLLNCASRSSAIVLHWRVITITHCTVDASLANCASVCLSACFYILIIAISMLVLLADKGIHPLCYAIYAIALLIGFVAVHVTLYVLALPSERSRLSLHVMFRDCSDKSATSRVRLRETLRTIKSLRVISFHYGSLGTIKTATRVDYMFSVLNHSINLILSVRNIFWFIHEELILCSHCFPHILHRFWFVHWLKHYNQWLLKFFMPYNSKKTFFWLQYYNNIIENVCSFMSINYSLNWGLVFYIQLYKTYLSTLELINQSIVFVDSNQRFHVKNRFCVSWNYMYTDA